MFAWGRGRKGISQSVYGCLCLVLFPSPFVSDLY